MLRLNTHKSPLLLEQIGQINVKRHLNFANRLKYLETLLYRLTNDGRKLIDDFSISSHHVKLFPIDMTLLTNDIVLSTHYIVLIIINIEI